MKSYMRGFFTGTLLITSLFTFTALDHHQIEGIEKEIVKIWEKERAQDQFIKKNEFRVLSIESDIDINSKSMKLYLKSLQKQIDKLTNQLNEHCECYRNQILLH